MDGNNAEPGGKNWLCDVLRAVEPTDKGLEGGLMTTLIHVPQLHHEPPLSSGGNGQI